MFHVKQGIDLRSGQTGKAAFREEIPKRTGRAIGRLAAEVLPRIDQEGMILVEQGSVAGKQAHDQLADLRDFHGLWYQTVPEEYALRISVADKNGFPAGIQQNAVGCFRADAADAKEFFPEQG